MFYSETEYFRVVSLLYSNPKQQKAIGICLPTDSTATTQQATKPLLINHETSSTEKWKHENSGKS